MVHWCDKGKAVGILDYYIGAMCEIGGINISRLHRVIQQLQIPICSTAYHYQNIAGLTYGVIQELYNKSVKSAFEEDHGNVLVGDGTLDSRRQEEYCTYTLIAKVSKRSFPL